MDLLAGDPREVLLAVALEDGGGLRDTERLGAHLSFGGSMDPTWLDLFSQAVRAVTGLAEPSDFLDARLEMGNRDGAIGERTVERIDGAWITAIARVDDRDLDAIAGRWIDLLVDELGDLPREEKPWIRQLAGELVDFARRADAEPAVIFAWSL
ncbi:MAG: hypothetical protein FIA92_05665 [Chloroflexi bacterium]|nr:hypothetical protein [Chloroflexota bacterium]